jgi:hypothetical protein
MAGILDIHGEVVTRGVVAVVGTPVARAHLLILRPALEGRRREVEDHHPLARPCELDERVIRPLAPPQRRLLLLVVIQDHHVVGRQCLRARAAEFLCYPHFEAPGVFEKFAQHGRGGAPVVPVLPGDDERLQFLRSGGLLRRKTGQGQGEKS